MKVIHYHKDTCPSKGQKTADDEKVTAESMFDDGRPGHWSSIWLLGVVSWAIPGERWLDSLGFCHKLPSSRNFAVT